MAKVLWKVEYRDLKWEGKILGPLPQTPLLSSSCVAVPLWLAASGLSDLVRRPGLDPGQCLISDPPVDRERRGGWVYIMADRYRGKMYVGVTANLPTRVFQHRERQGSDFCASHRLRMLVWAERGETIEACIAHEKRLKRWHRSWKFELIERDNPDWVDLYDQLV